MEITLPGLKHEFDWPPHRRDLADGVRGPDAGGDIGHKEVPGQPRQMGLGRGIAFLLRLLLSVPPAFIDDRFWDSRRHETRGHTRCFPQEHRALQELPLDRGEPMRQVNGVPPTGCRGPERRVMIEPTEKIGASRGKARESCECKIAQINDQQHACMRSCHHGIDRALVGNVPWRQRTMTQDTVLIVPHGVNFGPSFGRTPARAGAGLVQGFWQSKAGAVSEIHMRKGGKQSIITHVFEGLDFGKGLTEHGLKKSNGLLVHPLVNGFRRDVHLLAQWRDLRRSWCPCRVGLTPSATRHEGEEEFARHLRRTLDKAGATCRGFDVVGRQEVGSHGYRTACTGRHGSLPGMV